MLLSYAQHAPIQHAARPAYLPVPVSIPLTAHSLVLPSPPQQASYQTASSAYSGQYRPAQQPPQPQYPAQPQYAPQPQPAYPAPAYPAPQTYAAPAPTASPFPVLPPLPVPIYARKPQQAPEYAPAPVEYTPTEAYAAPPAEYATASPLEVTDAAPEAQVYEQSAPAGGYAPAEPVTIPPSAEEIVSTDSPVPEQAAQANTVAKTPTKAEESQWTQGSIPWTLEKLGQNTLNDLLVLSGLDETFDKEGECRHRSRSGGNLTRRQKEEAATRFSFHPTRPSAFAL